MNATSLSQIILLLSLIVTWSKPPRLPEPEALAYGRLILSNSISEHFTLADSGLPVSVAWHLQLLPPGRTQARRNPVRNRARWHRRLRTRQRFRRSKSRRRRRGRRQAGPQLRFTSPPPYWLARPTKRASCTSFRGHSAGSSSLQPPDPLAHLRQSRGWIDHLPEDELWEVLRQIRWAAGLSCPHCGEDAPTCLETIGRQYRGGMFRYRCLVCALAGDPGEGGTFTDLTGTIFDGCRLDIRSLWLIIEMFVEQAAAVETADEVGVNRHTVDRYFRLLRGAIYQAQSSEPITLDPNDIVEGDEVYLTAGLKGGAGGLELAREPRRRGLKRRGRGTWDSDRLPVLGLICRGGELRLFVLRNVQSATIRPIVEQMIQQGAKVYTDGYKIYNFLDQAGYHHASVNHSAGEYARGEVHCNTIECTWSWLRQMIRTYRGVSKVYLPLYVAQFEFFYNRRHHNRWNRMLDVLSVAFQADAASLLANVEGAEFAQICPVAG